MLDGRAARKTFGTTFTEEEALRMLPEDAAARLSRLIVAQMSLGIRDMYEALAEGDKARRVRRFALLSKFTRSGVECLSEWAWGSEDHYWVTFDAWREMLYDFETMAGAPHYLDVKVPEVEFPNNPIYERPTYRDLMEQARARLAWVREIDFLGSRRLIPAGYKSFDKLHRIGLLSRRPGRREPGDDDSVHQDFRKRGIFAA